MAIQPAKFPIAGLDIKQAKVKTSCDLAMLLHTLSLQSDKILIKVNWFGPEYGYFTDAATLDLVLSALPDCEKVIIEGHAYGRNDGSREIDWRDRNLVHSQWQWIQDQEQWFLESNGLQEVLERHQARYINVTDEVWSGAIAQPTKVAFLVEETFSPIAKNELYSSVPQQIWELRGAPLISLSRIKLRSTNALAEDHSPHSPIFSLSMKNLFGLIPDPFRFRWHGTKGEHLAQSILDINKVYASMFDVIGLNEGIFHMLINDPRGELETNWGHYDILEDQHVAFMGRNLVNLDVHTASTFFPLNWERWPLFALAEKDLGPVKPKDFPAPHPDFQGLIRYCHEHYLQADPAVSIASTRDGDW